MTSANITRDGTDCHQYQHQWQQPFPQNNIHAAIIDIIVQQPTLSKCGHTTAGTASYFKTLLIIITAMYEAY